MTRIIKLVISLIFWMGCWLRRKMKGISKEDSPGTCLFLYYHSVTSDQRKQFAQQMEDLVRLAKPIDGGFIGPLKPNMHYVGITFDDGFACVIENALPELIKHRIPATIFIPTGYLGRHPEWVNDQDYEERNEMVMTSKQLFEFPSGLISIGSHSVTHRMISSLTEEEARRELYQSRNELESLLGRKIKHFAFPYGNFNLKVVEWAREAGYERVFTNLPTLAYSEKEEYVTGRVWANSTDTRLEFILKVQGAYCWLPFAFTVKRKVRHLVERNRNRNNGFKPMKME